MIRRISLVLTCLSSLAGALHADSIFGSTTDVELNEGNILQASTTGPTIRAGASGSAPAGGRNAFLVFQLPDFGTTANPFLSADFGLNLATLTGTPAYNVDLYGLGIQSSATITLNSGALSTPRFYESDALDPNATLIQLDFTTPATNSLGFKNTDITGDLNLLNFLNAVYADGSGANQFVVFRINPDANLNTATVGYNYSSADAGTVANVAGAGTTFDPVINYSAVPEPAALSLCAFGSLLTLRRRRHASVVA
jgi:hypothetical protein